MNYILIRVNKKNKNAVIEELTLREYAASENIDVDAVFYDKSMQKDVLNKREEFLEFLKKLEYGDKIIISSIDMLGWRVGELVQIISTIFDKGGTILCAAENEKFYPQMPSHILLSKLSKTRSQNIEKGVSKLGRPKGSRSKSKYDAHLPAIMEFLKKSRNISALARELGVSRTSLKDYIASRRL